MEGPFYFAVNRRDDMRRHRCAEIGCRELIKPGWTYCQPHYEARMNKYVHARQVNADRNAKT